MAYQNANVSSDHSPKLLAVIYAFTLPYDITPLVGGFAITTLSAAALIAGLCIFYAAPRTRVKFDSGPTGVLYGLTLWTFLTCLWSVAPSVTFAASMGMAVNIALAILLIPVIHVLWKPMLLAYAIGGLYLSASLIANSDGDSWRRAQFMGADENITAFALAVAVAAAIGIAQMSGARRALVLYMVALLHAAAIAFTGSRTGLLAVAAVFSLAALDAVRRRGLPAASKLLPWALLVSAVLGLTWLLGRGQLSERLSDFSGANFAGDQQRTGILKLYWHNSQDWALIGVGQGADAHFLSSVAGQFRNTHGLVWKTWVELGVVGLALYVVLGGIIVARLFVDTPWRRASLALMAAMLPFWIALGGQSTAIFWFAVAVIVGKPVHSEGGHPTAYQSRTRDRPRTRVTSP